MWDGILFPDELVIGNQLRVYYDTRAQVLHIQTSVGSANPLNASLWTDVATFDILNNIFTCDGRLNVAGTLNQSVSSTAPAVATSGTITTAGVVISRVAPAGAVTGVILQPGTVQGQVVTVVNESTGADSVTFAAAGTSNVADGTSAVIAGLTQKTFVWDGSLWYHS